MSTAAHTPGPWHYQEGSDAYTHIVRTGEIGRDHPYVGRRFLCQLAQDTSGEAEANARLIAAAPDYDAAARMLLAGLPDETFQYRETLTKSEVEHLNAAIWMFKAARTKAEGRS